MNMRLGGMLAYPLILCPQAGKTKQKSSLDLVRFVMDLLRFFRAKQEPFISRNQHLLRWIHVKSFVLWFGNLTSLTNYCFL